MTTKLNRARLEYELARRGMTGLSLADESGIPFQTISEARNGRPVRRATLAAIVSALERRPIVDMGLLEEPEKKTPEAGVNASDEAAASSRVTAGEVAGDRPSD